MKMTHVECVLSDDVSTCCDDVAARTLLTPGRLSPCASYCNTMCEWGLILNTFLTHLWK